MNRLFHQKPNEAKAPLAVSHSANPSNIWMT